MNNKELKSLDEALDYLNEESIEALLEFNIKESLEKFIENIKKAIVKLIDKANEALSKCKDSKLKSTIKGILDKAKKLLTKSDNITTEKQATEISEEVKELNENLKNPYIPNAIINACKDNSWRRVVEALRALAYFCNKEGYLEFKESIKYVENYFGDNWEVQEDDMVMDDKFKNIKDDEALSKAITKYYVDNFSLEDIAKKLYDSFSQELVDAYLLKGKKVFHLI